MAFWNRKKAEKRSLENPQVPISGDNIVQFLGFGSMSEAGVVVNSRTALSVPAIWAAVNFLAGTIAGLPLKVYRKTDEGREEVPGGLGSLLHGAVNPEMSSFEWRKYKIERALTNGRGLTFIERNSMGRIINLWPLDPEKVTVKMVGARKHYVYSEGGRPPVVYEAKDIIDLPFMIGSDLVTAESPIARNADTIGLAIAATNYGSRFFQNGGVPPFALIGNFQTSAGMKRAAEDLEAAILKASKEGRTALTLPQGHDLKQIGADPAKTQLTELKRFCIEEIARIYSIPPTFLQDLTHGTFSNTEQQDLHFVKHTVKRWVEQLEQEMNLKLFGRSNNKTYVEFNLDGLLRGDFTTRMQGYATGIQNAIIKPQEARDRENLPLAEGSDTLLVQGATVPLGSQPGLQEEPAQDPVQEPEQDEPENEDEEVPENE